MKIKDNAHKRPMGIRPALTKPANMNPLQREMAELRDEFASYGAVPCDKEIRQLAQERLARAEAAARLKLITER